MSDIPGGPTPPPPPPPMMSGPQGGIPPKTLGEILSSAFNIYKANASQLILIVAVVVDPLSLVSALFAGVVFAPDKVRVTKTGGVVVFDYAGRGLGVSLLAGAIGALIAVLISAVLQAAILRAVFHDARHQLPVLPRGVGKIHARIGGPARMERHAQQAHLATVGPADRAGQVDEHAPRADRRLVVEHVDQPALLHHVPARAAGGLLQHQDG